MSKVLEDSDSYVRHYGNFEASGGKVTVLEINIPVSEYKKIATPNPKVMGARTWQEYLKQLELHEPEVIQMWKYRGKNVKDKAKNEFLHEQTNRVAVRGVIKPEWIKVKQSYDL